MKPGRTQSHLNYGESTGIFTNLNFFLNFNLSLIKIWALTCDFFFLHCWNLFKQNRKTKSILLNSHAWSVTTVKATIHTLVQHWGFSSIFFSLSDHCSVRRILKPGCWIKWYKVWMECWPKIRKFGELKLAIVIIVMQFEFLPVRAVIGTYYQLFNIVCMSVTKRIMLDLVWAGTDCQAFVKI